MEIVRLQNNTNKRYCAAVGFFDGVHRGHRYLIEELKSIAKEKNQESLIITFAIHPRKILQTEFQPELLTTLNEKKQLLQSTGIDACAVLDFSPEIARMSAWEFMQEVLKDKYGVDTLLVGHDHRFGHNREESFEDYKIHGQELGIDVRQAACYTENDKTSISSSEIRKALHHGDIEKANQLLGYNYSFSGNVTNGFKVGRKIGFPTANLITEHTEKLIPKIGVYAVKVEYNGETYAGMLNIGNRPTLNNGDNVSIEVHIIDFDKDIYDETLKIEFLAKIRDEKKFKAMEELIAQLEKDKQKVLELWSTRQTT